MDHLEQMLTKLMEAQKLRGTNALNEICEALDKHLDKACSEHDTLVAGYDELDRENAELRRRLRVAGLSDKIEEEANAGQAA